MKNSNPKAFLFVADTSQSDLDTLLRDIDHIQEIENWFKFLPSAVVLVSHHDVNELSRLLRIAFPKQRHILVRLEEGGKDGWLPFKAWDFMNQPKAAPQREVAETQPDKVSRRYGPKTEAPQGVAEAGRSYWSAGRGKVS